MGTLVRVKRAREDDIGVALLRLALKILLIRRVVGIEEGLVAVTLVGQSVGSSNAADKRNTLRKRRCVAHHNGDTASVAALAGSSDWPLVLVQLIDQNRVLTVERVGVLRA